MSEYALNNFGLKLEEIRRGKVPVDDYQMDISGVFPSYEEVECENPYILSLTSLLFGDKKEEKNPYELDLSDVLNGNIQLKRQHNPYEIDLNDVFKNKVQFKKYNPYELDLSNILNGDIQVKKQNNPYEIDLNEVFKNKVQVKKQNPYVLDLTDVFKKDFKVKNQKNPYELDLSSLFPDSNTVKYNPYTMDIKSLTKKEEVHLKKEISKLLNNYMECKLNNTKQEQEAINDLLNKYGVSIKKIKSGRPSIIKIGNTLYIPNEYLEEIEKVLKEKNIIID